MAKYPLALLPVVTIAGGQARLAPDAYGVSIADVLRTQNWKQEL